jgi:predicted DNA-binding protein (UPF0251 family)
MGTTFEEFEHDLRDSLAHLYDPTYQPPQLLWAVTRSDPKQGVQPLQAMLIQEIENLKPAPNVPLNARIQLIYNVLSCRYLQGLTQEEAAKCVGITSRTLRRVQQQAINLLAQRLWENHITHTSSKNTGDFPVDLKPPTEETEEEATWRSQLREELATLQERTPGLVTDVGEIINGAVEVGRTLTSKHGLGLNVSLPETSLQTTAHASILRQILIRSIGKLVKYISSGEISIQAWEEGEDIHVSIAGYSTDTATLPYSDFIQEASASQGGSFEVLQKGEQIIYQVTLPSASSITVLVVEDNIDLVHFYQRYVAGTRYEIVHLAEGQHLFETIGEMPPDIIVLDVMLPGIDG